MLCLATLAAVALLANCGEPLGPLEGRWVKVADFPPDVWRVGTIVPFWFEEGAGVYAVVERGAASALVACSRYGCSIDFEINERYDGGYLADVAMWGIDIWISGAKVSGKTTTPLILKKTLGGEWEEIPLPFRAGAAATAVIPIDDADYWFLTGDEREARRGLLNKYSGGEVTTYDGFGDVTAAMAWDPGRRGNAAAPRLYAVSCGGPPVKVFITADEGASWVEETMAAGVVPGYHLMGATATTTAGLVLYMIVRLGYEGEAGNYYAVVKRTGLPGSGEYEALFISGEGPYFKTLANLAFEHPGYGGSGLGVGRDTTVVFKEGKVYLERLPYPLNFAGVVLSPTNGFLAVGENSAFGGWELLYHP